MKTICIVPCGKRKIWDKILDAGPKPAREVYIGSFSKKCQQYAQMFYPGSWYIISAKYGFLSPYDVVPERYDVTFLDSKTKPIGVEELIHQAEKRNLMGCDRLVVVAGRKYVEMVELVFPGKEIIHILEGCHGIGDMMGQLNRLINESR